MYDTIVTNLLLPGVFVALVVGLPLWRVLRTAAHDRQRPDDRPPDPSREWIRATAVLSVFGPFWYQPYLRPHLRASEFITTKESDLT
jgi:hypothetical protein